MQDKLAKLRSSLVSLLGVTLIELSLIFLAFIVILTTSYYIFGSDTASNLANLVALVWLFLLHRKHSSLSLRLNENDDRDQDFRDECDHRFDKLENNP